MPDLQQISHFVLLLMVANGAPIIARNLCGEHAARPIDGGRRLLDGQRLFGQTKTWRGVLAAIVMTMLAGLPLGYAAWDLFLLATLSMSGDLFSSFVKRRLGMASSSRAPGLDQVPEALFPLLVLQQRLGLDGYAVAVSVTLFVLLDMWLSKLLHRWHIRRKPY